MKGSGGEIHGSPWIKKIEQIYLVDGHGWAWTQEGTSEGGTCKEKALVEMTRFGGLLGSNVETKYNGNSLEFMRVTPCNGGYGLTISCDQEKIPMEELGHEPSHKTYNFP